MEKEVFLSGYCRVQDQSRMVCAVVVDGKVEEVDCCYGSCPYEPNCQIAAGIRQTEQP
jgi:hypothetical protein